MTPSPMTSMTASEMIQAGDLAGARTALTEAVKRAPTDGRARFALAEVLILQGELERADTHLDLASTQDPSWGMLVALQRQLVRAAKHRDEVFAAGRSPDLVTAPTPAVETALRILTESRAGGDAAALREAADVETPELTGVCDGRPFSTLRDGDDRTADVLELMTSTGKYVWAGWSEVVSLQLRPVERPRDLVWRAADLELRDGPTGVVYLPMTYSAPAAELTDPLRLARETDWTERAGLTCGLGQRCLLVGDDLVALSTVRELSVAAADAGRG